MEKQICYQLFVTFFWDFTSKEPITSKALGSQANPNHFHGGWKDCWFTWKIYKKMVGSVGYRNTKHKEVETDLFSLPKYCVSFLSLAFCYECKCILDFSCRATTVWSTPRAQGKSRLYAIATKCSKSVSGTRSEAQHSPAHTNSSRSCSAITEKRTEI